MVKMGEFVKKTEALDREYFDGQRHRLIMKKEVINGKSRFWREILENDFDLENQMSSDEFNQEFGLKRIRRLDADSYDLRLANQNIF